MADDSNWAGRGFTRPGPDARAEHIPADVPRRAVSQASDGGYAIAETDREAGC